MDDLSGEFMGALTTNAMEGGNWRIKYELRADYLTDDSIEARCILIALKDSTRTFKEGMPSRIFSDTNEVFTFQGVMDKRTIAGEPVEAYIYR